MILELLRKIGLTGGEIKVYRALLKLGQSSTGNIMKKSGISSSKVYLILEKLIQKGLVSYIIKNNVKYFQTTNPKTIIDYLENKKEDIDKTKKELEKALPYISGLMAPKQEESAQVYKGVKGMKVAFGNLFDEMKKGEEYCFFNTRPEEISERKVSLFFTNMHKKRVSKGIHVKGIADNSLKRLYSKMKAKIFRKNFKIRHCKLTMPTGMTIGKNRVLILLWGDEITTYELISKRVADNYREFFNKIWKMSK